MSGIGYAEEESSFPCSFLAVIFTKLYRDPHFGCGNLWFLTLGWLQNFITPAGFVSSWASCELDENYHKLWYSFSFSFLCYDFFYCYFMLGKLYEKFYGIWSYEVWKFDAFYLAEIWIFIHAQNLKDHTQLVNLSQSR